MPPPGFFHGVYVHRLSHWIQLFLDQHPLGWLIGEVGFRIAADPDTVRSPDIAFISQARLDAAGGPTHGYLSCAPDLAIEVLSPNDSLPETQAKAQEYLDAGSILVWIVNPRRRQVQVFRSHNPPRIHEENDELDGDAVLPGFRCSVSAIFS